MDSRRTLPMIVGLLAAWLVGCGGQADSNSGGTASRAKRQAPASRPAATIAVPTPDVARADDAAREQMTSLRSKLDAAIDDGDADATATAYGDLGSAYLVYDFLEAARACFANARSLAPDDFRWSYLLGYVHQLEGDLTAAVPLYEGVVSRQPRFVPAWLRVGRAYLERGELDAAHDAFGQALTVAPDVAAGLEGHGKVAAARGELDEAIDYLERALTHAPRANSLNYALAQLHRRQGDLETAQAYLDVRGDVAVRIDDPLLNPLGTLGQSVQLHLMHAAEAMEDADYETAAGAYRQALDVDDNNFTAYRGLSYAVEKLGDLDGAIAHLEAALDHMDEDDPARAAAQRAEAQRILGGLQALAGRDDRAITWFEASLTASTVAGASPTTEQTAVRLKLANALARQQRYEDAIGHYDAVLAQNLDEPTRAAVLERRATSKVNLGQRDAAVADFRLALAAAPDDAGLRLRFADALAALGDDAAAMEVRGEATRQSGGEAERAQLLAETGRRLVSERQFQQAVDHFDASLALDAEQPAVRNQLATVLGHLGFFDDALREFRTVIEAAPRHAAARRGEITVLLLTEQFGVARVRLQDALRTFPLDADLALLQARLLATCPDPAVRDGALALEIARRLHRVRQDAPVRETLAAALATSGQYDEAATLQRRLIAEAEQAGDDRRVALLRDRLARFEAHQAWAAGSGEEIVAAARSTPASTASKGT